MNARLILGFTAVTVIPAVYADNVTVNSSTAVTFLSSGTTTTDFPSPFTAANFTSARTGSNAAVLTSTPYYTTAASLTTAGAQWIGTAADAGASSSDGFTALYAIKFTIADAFASSSLTLNYEVDNALGDTNPGVYLNGVALPASTGISCGIGVACFGSFDGLQTYTDNSVTADLVQGTNWLYIDAVNLGAEGGLIFSADVSTVNSAAAVPEPSLAILMSTMLLAVALVARRGITRGPSRQAR